MAGKAKIEGLTNSWYGCAVFLALVSIVRSGFGIVSIGTAIAGMLFSWVITFFLGRALVNRSSLVRVLLVLSSGLFTVLGTLGVAGSVWIFMQTWQLGLLGSVVTGVVSAYMNAKSFVTLTDASVKAYIA